MSDIRQRISSGQRMDMVLKGLNPLLEGDVKAYLQKGGKIRNTQEATLERLSTLVGEDILQKGSLGSGHEKETDYGTAYKESGLPMGSKYLNGDADFKPTKPSDYQRMAVQQLNEYGDAGFKDIDPEQLLSFRKDPRQRQVQRESVDTKQDFRKVGYDLSIKYLNAFIINLKNPSTKTRIELFKKLKIVLEYEGKLKNNERAVQAFKKGCFQAEEKMYNQLKS